MVVMKADEEDTVAPDMEAVVMVLADKDTVAVTATEVDMEEAVVAVEEAVAVIKAEEKDTVDSDMEAVVMVMAANHTVAVTATEVDMEGA